MTILHLVDSIEYAEANCYQHQLSSSFKGMNVQTMSLPMALSGRCTADAVVCCLKQRTVNRQIKELSRFFGDVPWVMYDQDPWEALKDDSPFKGTYELAKQTPNLRAIAVTTHHYEGLLRERGLPGEFVKMGMLPQYCDEGPNFDARPMKVAFLGTLHPRRKRLVEELQKLRIHVEVRPNSLGYAAFLRALHDVSIFIHNEDTPIIIDGKHENMGKGMWIKDVEAAARGCYSIRNFEQGYTSYCVGIPTIKLYQDPVDAAALIRTIQTMNPEQRSLEITNSVQKIREQNDWHQTAKRLIELATST